MRCAAEAGRRRFLQQAGAAIATAAAAAWLPPVARAQGLPLRFADMHAHLGFKQGLAIREAMTRNGMLIVAEKVVPDGSVTRAEKGAYHSFREARPGELRRNFEVAFARRRATAKQEGLIEITSAEILDRVLKERTPAFVLAAEGADFLENDLAFLDKARADGLAHLQLVHYYRHSGVGDISTEEPAHGGLTAFGKDVVRTCNRLGMLVDVAHCTSAGIEQVLELSTKPIIYSHGHVSAAAPSPSQGATAARAIYAPLARRIADGGGVLGVWPLWYSYANLHLYADELARLVNVYGVEHVGIGSDMFGLPRTIMPSYEEFAELPGYLGKRGLKDADIEAVLGGNYIRVLRQALAT
jgi:membrane dipeptidase